MNKMALRANGVPTPPLPPPHHFRYIVFGRGRGEAGETSKKSIHY